MSNAPPPFTPARSDLRDFGFMPLEVTRFRGSDLVAEAEPEAILAAIMLWTAAWHETPAASLSDSDRLLAKAAGFGRSVDAWLKHKDEALRGFVKCSDGRLYHPVVARLANEAWKGKVKQRHHADLARRRKWNERHPDEPALLMPSFELFASHYPENCPEDKAGMSQGQLPLPADSARTRTGASSIPNDDDNRQGEEETRRAESHKDKAPLSQGQGGNVTRTKGECFSNIGSKGQRKGQGKGQLYRNDDDPLPPDAAPSAGDDGKPQDLFALTNTIANAGGVSIIQPTKITRAVDTVKSWIEAGISVDDTILPTIAKRLLDMRPEETVGSLAFYDAAIRKAHALVKGKAKPRNAEPMKEIGIPDSDDPRVATIRAEMRSVLGDRTYDRWLSPKVTALIVNGTSARLRTTSPFTCDWIASHFGKELERIVLNVTGIDDVTVTL